MLEDEDVGRLEEIEKNEMSLDPFAMFVTDVHRCHRFLHWVEPPRPLKSRQEV